ncbi:MAG: hypothetical protein K0S14_1266, partial [Thermomicrobiales bacterium]|nr:hypothetical protein [Thermomicrobiales bacterium]
GPFQRLMHAASAAEGGSVLAASVFAVQPWLDIAEMGFATVAVTDGDAMRAEQVAIDLAKPAWFERDAFMETELVPIVEAIARADAIDGPVVLSDLADGTGAGSPGDATAVIAALLAADLQAPALVCVRDPAAANQAIAAGVGAIVALEVGGKLGDCAVVQAGRVSLLILSNSVMTVDPAMYRAVGLEPNDAGIVVVKSHIQFRAGYAGIARAIILLDSPGMSSDRLESLPFVRIERPLFPFDRAFAFVPRPVSRQAAGAVA